MSEEKQVCEHCEKEFDELVTRQGFIMTHFVEFVCEGCFEKLEGVKFDDYTIEHYYNQG